MAMRETPGFNASVPVRVSAAPSVIVPQSGLESAFSVFGALGKEMADREKKKQVIAAERAGAAQETSDIGIVDNQLQVIPVLERRDGVKEDVLAFNRAAEHSYKLRLDTTLRNTVEAASIRNPADPATLTRELQSFYAGVRQTVPADLRPEVDNAYLRLAQPMIRQAMAKRMELDAKDRETAIKDGTSSIVGLASSYGIDIGQYQASPGVANQRLDALAGEYGKQARAIVGNISPLYSPVQAGNDLLVIQQQTSEALIRGAFDGSKDKASFYAGLIEGRMGAIVPVTDEKGNVTFESQPIQRALTPKQIEGLRTYMSNAVDAQWTAGQRRRTAFEQAAEDHTKRALSALAVDPNKPGAVDKIWSDPLIPWSTKMQIRNDLRTLSDEGIPPREFSSTIDAIRGGISYTDRELFAKGMSARQIDEARKEIDKVKQFDGSAEFKAAKGYITARLPVSTVAVVGSEATSATRSEQLAAAVGVLTTGLYDITRKMVVDQGYVLGTIPNGKETEERNGVRYFDPVNVVQKVVKEAEEEARDRTAEVQAATKREDEAAAKLREISKTTPRNSDRAAILKPYEDEVKAARAQRLLIEQDPDRNLRLANILQGKLSRWQR